MDWALPWLILIAVVSTAGSFESACGGRVPLKLYAPAVLASVASVLIGIIALAAPKAGVIGLWIAVCCTALVLSGMAAKYDREHGRPDRYESLKAKLAEKRKRRAAERRS